MPAGNPNALSLGRQIIEPKTFRTDTDPAVIQCLSEVQQTYVGAGWPCPAKGTDDQYLAVYAALVGSEHVLYGGNPSDPMNPTVLTVVPTGAANVQFQEEGANVVLSSTLNVVGAAATVTDVAGVATLTITGNTYTAGDGIDIDGSNAISVDIVSAKGLEIVTESADQKLQIKEYAGILLDTNGVSVDLATDPGLEFDAAGAAGKLRAKAGTNMSRTSTGINWNHTGISGWNAADAEKFLKHNLGVLSWGAGDGNDGGGTTVSIYLATVNDATHVIGSDTTFAFDNTTDMGIGTTPSSGTATNVRARAFIDNEVFLAISNGTTHYGFKLSPTIANASVNDASGVPLDATTFGLDNFNTVLNVAPTSGTATNVPQWATDARPQYADNQVLNALLLLDDGTWYPLTGGYNTALAKVTTQISARSGTYTWGSGVATVLKKTGNGTHSATGGKTGITIYNTTDALIAVDDVIQIKRIDGEWFVDVGDC
jgi:hypothetical protein